jgi:hypothetical protein
MDKYFWSGAGGSILERPWAEESQDVFNQFVNRLQIVYTDCTYFWNSPISDDIN